MKNKIIEYTRNLLNNKPDDWLKLTTHRLDIYNEKLAKDQFLNELEKLFKKKEFSNQIITGISSTKNDTKITIAGVKDKPGIAALIFEPLSKNLIKRHLYYF